MRENRPVFQEKTERPFYILYRDADAGLKDERQLFSRHDLHPVERAYHQREVEFLHSARRFQQANHFLCAIGCQRVFRGSSGILQRREVPLLLVDDQVPSLHKGFRETLCANLHIRAEKRPRFRLFIGLPVCGKLRSWIIIVPRFVCRDIGHAGNLRCGVISPTYAPMIGRQLPPLRMRGILRTWLPASPAEYKAAERERLDWWLADPLMPLSHFLRGEPLLLFDDGRNAVLHQKLRDLAAVDYCFV